MPHPDLSRRSFLTTLGVAGVAAAAAPALVGLTRKTPRPIAGGFVDDGGRMGHALRDRTAAATAPRETRRVPIVIVGGGMAGLSAGWWLARAGVRDFVVLELERDAGGNSRWGQGASTAYPWAAHYVPVPGAGATLARELFAELGVLHADGTWEERWLVHEPQERLWLHGEWHDGVRPEFALPAAELAEFARFDARIAELRASGAFTIPLAGGAAAMAAMPAHLAALDRLTMADWLAREGFRSPALRWWVDYGCRDDYGASAGATSAWAGVHYHAAREADEQGPLAWPAGNGWIIQQLLERLAPHVVTGAPVHRVSRDGARWRVRAGDVEYLADGVIWAAPSFVAPHVVGELPPLSLPEQSPWLTANLVLDRPPVSRGTPQAWDNVIYGSPSLGYVVANHQQLAQHTDEQVWTYYLALAGEPPAAARQRLLARGWDAWVDDILRDLQRAHPDIRDCVRRVDVLRLAHAMPRPSPGFLHRVLAPPTLPPRFWMAHSDLSGLSIFEEAQYRGVLAAQAAIAELGGA